MNSLRDLYYSPSTGYSGINKLYERARRDGMQVKRKDVVDFLNGEDVYQRFTKKEPYNSYVAYAPLEEFQIDLIVMKDISKIDYTYCFTCIDVTTRIADAEPMKDKTASEALQAFKAIIERMGKPKQIYADSGKEWQGVFGKFLEEEGINAIFVTTHAPFIERFNQTLKNMLHRYMTNEGYDRWRSVLPEIIDNYNNSYHSTIKMSPNDAKKDYDLAVENTLRNAQLNVKKKIDVGDKVRLAKKKDVFTKGYLPTFGATQYTVENIEDGMYYLDGLEYPVPRSQIKKFQDVDGVVENVDEGDRLDKELRYKRRIKKSGVNEDNVLEGKRERVKNSKFA